MTETYEIHEQKCVTLLDENDIKNEETLLDVLEADSPEKAWFLV